MRSDYKWDWLCDFAISCIALSCNATDRKTTHYNPTRNSNLKILSGSNFYLVFKNEYQSQSHFHFSIGIENAFSFSKMLTQLRSTDQLILKLNIQSLQLTRQEKISPTQILDRPYSIKHTQKWTVKIFGSTATRFENVNRKSEQTF